MAPKQDLTSKREYFKPFNYPWAYDAWLKHEQSHWLHTEVPMAEDVKDWKERLTTNEKSFLTNIFRFFTQGDIDVADGYVTNYLPYFPQPEVRMMLSGFAAREALHVAAYSHLIETLGMPESTYSEFLEYQAMADKHEYFMDLSKANGTKDYNILGIENRIEQIVANLLENSISFSEDNQKILVEISKDENGRLSLIVLDEGVGFSEKDTNKIFNRFYSNRPDKFGEHSGLGLNIVKNLVDLHEGEITASNRDNNSGALIEIKFPTA